MYIPETAIIEVTKACNFSCIHCGAVAGIKRDNELSLEEIKIVVSDLKLLGCKAISLMGGEIFLRNDWPEIASVIIDAGLNCGIITNGYLLDSAKLKLIKNLGIIQVGISLDAGNSYVQYQIRGVKNSFDKAINAIRLSIKEKIEYITVITAVSKVNIDQLYDIFNILKDFNAYIDWQIKLASSHSEDRFPRNLVIKENDYIFVAEFIKNKRKDVKIKGLKLRVSGAHDLGYCSENYLDMPSKWQGCLAGINTVGIQSDGSVKGCLALSDEFVEGNIRSDSLLTIWNDDNLFINTRKFKRNYLTGICKTCDKSNICHGGCHDFCYSLTKSVYNVPYCLYQIENKYKS